jgi:hypothetical protein
MAAKKANPMVARSIVWPISAAPGAENVSPAGTRHRMPARDRKIATKPSTTEDGSDAPVSVRTPVSKSKRAGKAKDDFSPWSFFN